MSDHPVVGQKWSYYNPVGGRTFMEGAECIDYVHDDVGGADFYLEQLSAGTWPKDRAWGADDSVIIRALAVASGLAFGTVWQRAVELWGGRHTLKRREPYVDCWGKPQVWVSDDLNRQMAAITPHLVELGFTKIPGDVAWNDLPTDRPLIVVTGLGNFVIHVTGLVNGTIHDLRDVRTDLILGRYERRP